MSLKAKLATLVMTVAFIAPVGTSATAATPLTQTEIEAVASQVFNSANPEAAFAQLTPEVQQQLTAATTEASEEITSQTEILKMDPNVVGMDAVSAGATACYKISGYGKGKSLAGVTLYEYRTQLQYCVNKQGIVSTKWVSRTGQAKFPGWKYNGLGASAKTNTAKSVSAYQQYHFALAPIGKNFPAQNVDPCQGLRVTSTGTQKTDFRCGV